MDENGASATGPTLTAIVTGASSGLGEAAARRLAREPGISLVLVARREQRLRALADALGSRRTSWVAVDLVADDAPERIRAHVAERYGRLDLLVNNAGAAWRKRFADGGYENVRRTMAINFDAQVRLTESLLPLLRASAPSAIVNVASTAARVTRSGTGAYSASKAALASWSDALWAEERANGVHVGLVLPGFISTEGFPQTELTASALTRWAVFDPREGRRGDLPGRDRAPARTLRAATVLAGVGVANPHAPPGAPGARRQQRRGDDDHDRRRPRRSARRSGLGLELAVVEREHRALRIGDDRDPGHLDVDRTGVHGSTQLGELGDCGVQVLGAEVDEPVRWRPR